MVIPALIYALTASYVVFDGAAPMREHRVATPSGMTRFHAPAADRLTRVDVDDLQMFERYLRTNGLTAVQSEDTQALPVVLARGDRTALARHGRVEETGLKGVYRVWLGPGVVDPHAIARKVAHDAAWAEPDRWIRFETRAVTLDDPYYPSLWHLHQTLNPRVAAGVNVRADEAWDLTRGDGPAGRPIIGVLDDGFHLAHPDLAPQMVDEGSGVVAKDLAEGDDDPSPHTGDGHGTKVLGVALAKGDNGLGVAGVCPECRGIAVRVFSSGSEFNSMQLYGPMSVAADGMRFVADHGARVINNSWGPTISPVSPAYFAMPQYVKDTVTELARRGPPGAEGSQGVLIVWAAGNNPGQVTSFDGWVSDPRTLAVGALNSVGLLATYSNIGPQIRIMAPSSDTFRKLPYVISSDGAEGYIQTFGGTSAAAPMVSGVAALVLARHPELSLAQLTEVLLDSAKKVTPDLANYGRNGQSCTRGFGMVDARAALEVADARAATYTNGHTLHTEVCLDGVDNDANATTSDTEGVCIRCIPTGARELMNGVDDDCDGYVDNSVPCTPTGKTRCETCTTSSECQVDFECIARADGKHCLRACSATVSCAYLEACIDGVCLPLENGAATECADYNACTPTNDGLEVCDGIDNDCNNVVDDVQSESPTALSQREVCNRDKLGLCADLIGICVSGAWVCSEPDPTLYEENETLCDAIDNDCDGEIDEGCKKPEPKKQCSAVASDTAWLMIAFLLLRRRVPR